MDGDVDIIRFEKTGKCYRTPQRGDVWAVRDLDLACRKGQLTCVLGPSGCGKTTLLRLAAGLEPATTGQVLVEGAAMSAPTGTMGLVSQEGDLLPWRRVGDNIALGLEIKGVDRTTRRTRAGAAIRRMRLPAETARSFPHELSGGMRQRVALARALCPNPPVLLMDEPFSRLDELTRYRLQEDLLDLWLADRQTVLFVTHSIEEAVFLADRVVVMTFGSIVADFPVDLPRPRDRLSPEFVDVFLRVRQALTEHETRAGRLDDS